MYPIQNNESPDIVVIGGGPIGLWTGIQTRLLSGKKVIIIEKNKEYQRSDIRLNIRASSLVGIPNDNKLKAMVKQWANRAVPIKVMEEALAQRAHELGITILKGYTADPKLLPQLFPTAKVFIGADGARSQVRKEIFQDRFKFNSNLQYLVQVQYVVKENPLTAEAMSTSVQIIKNASTTYRMQKFAKCLIIQNIHSLKDGSDRVTMQIFIDKAIYDQMTEATFKHPYYFETDLNKIPESLREVLIKWWGAREEFHDEIISADTNGRRNKLTVIALNSYSAKDVVAVDPQGRIWTIVGDAAGGFPFFRSLNNGLLLGTYLAKCISQGFESDNQKTLSSSLRSYSRYAYFRASIERIRAFIKNLFINLSKAWLQINDLISWPAISLSPDQKKQCYNRGVAIWTQLSGSPPPPPPAPDFSFVC